MNFIVNHDAARSFFANFSIVSEADSYGFLSPSVPFFSSLFVKSFVMFLKKSTNMFIH